MTETEKIKRGPGRPKGLGRVPGSGRKPGTPNRRTVQTRDRIQELADPIKFLADVMDGRRMVAAGDPGDMKKTWCYPTLTQRVQAGETLLRKLLPDLKSVENTGNLQPIITAIERRIVDPGSKATDATTKPPEGNGADKDVPEGGSGEAQPRFREPGSGARAVAPRSHN
ncbi:MAG: hypothetical protein V3S34_06755 [Hyphomicrobium sp.]